MKKIFATTTMVLFMLSVTTVLIAQPKTITINGKVTSFEESLPLEAVSIQVKGGSAATGTQADGTFSLAVSTQDKVLIISLAGYEKKEVLLTNAREYDIVLKRAGNFSYKREERGHFQAKQNEMLKED